MKAVSEIMFALVRCSICGRPLSPEVAKAITPQLLNELYSLSKPQDIAHVLAEALLSNDLISDDQAKNLYSKERMTAVFRHMQIKHELSKICRAFDEAEIKYMPLKGSVIRKYYPKPELRTSCDIDILVNPCDLDNACTLMTDKLLYKFDTRTLHDVSLYSQSKTHLELHFNLFESDDEDLNRVLSRIWDMSHAEKDSFKYELENDMFVVYHIAHMAKHFLHGGCGVRPFIDLWIAKNVMGYDEDNVLSILSECSLSEFGKKAMLLADVWLGGGTHTELTRKMEEYILNAPLYGTVENQVAIEKTRNGGGFKYCMNRLFMPYSKLKKMYPQLEKHPILYPYYQVKRWCRFVLRGRLSYATAEIKAAGSSLTDKEKNIVALCDELGLK